MTLAALVIPQALRQLHRNSRQIKVHPVLAVVKQLLLLLLLPLLFILTRTLLPALFFILIYAIPAHPPPAVPVCS